MLPSWLSCFTVVNQGSGFQISGVPAFCGFALQVAAPLAQSGWVPSAT